MNTFTTNLWSLGLPENWRSCSYDDAIEFVPNVGGCALRIESLRCDPRIITDQDLMHDCDGTAPQPISCGDFVGISCYEFMPTGYLRECWLRSEHVMLYVKFVTENDLIGDEDTVVDEILNTLKNMDAQQLNSPYGDDAQ